MLPPARLKRARLSFQPYSQLSSAMGCKLALDCLQTMSFALSVFEKNLPIQAIGRYFLRIKVSAYYKHLPCKLPNTKTCGHRVAYTRGLAHILPNTLFVGYS